jgi:hypothetical protein
MLKVVMNDHVVQIIFKLLFCPFYKYLFSGAFLVSDGSLQVIAEMHPLLNILELFFFLLEGFEASEAIYASCFNLRRRRLDLQCGGYIS